MSLHNKICDILKLIEHVHVLLLIFSIIVFINIRHHSRKKNRLGGILLPPSTQISLMQRKWLTGRKHFSNAPENKLDAIRVTLFLAQEIKDMCGASKGHLSGGGASSVPALLIVSFKIIFPQVLPGVQKVLLFLFLLRYNQKMQELSGQNDNNSWSSFFTPQKGHPSITAKLPALRNFSSDFVRFLGLSSFFLWPWFPLAPQIFSLQLGYHILTTQFGCWFLSELGWA